jgi:hypothetical protein
LISGLNRPPKRPRDKDNPACTRADIEKARPASEVLPGLIGAKATDELLRRGKGRPPKEHRKVNQTLRIDPAKIIGIAQRRTIMGVEDHDMRHALQKLSVVEKIRLREAVQRLESGVPKHLRHFGKEFIGSDQLVAALQQLLKQRPSS